MTLDTAIEIGRMFETIKDGMQVTAGEDPKVEINALDDRNGLPRRRRKPRSQAERKRKAQRCMRCGNYSHLQNEKYPAKNADV